MTTRQYISLLLVFTLQISILVPCILASGHLLMFLHMSRTLLVTLLLPLSLCIYGFLWIVGRIVQLRWQAFQFHKRKTGMKGQISSISTPVFEKMLSELRAEQWKIISRYAGFDAGIDYDFVVLEKRGVKLKFSWALYLDGSIEGAVTLLHELRERYSLG